MDGSVHVAGDPALLEETARLLREWETLGRPPIQDWRCASPRPAPPRPRSSCQETGLARTRPPRRVAVPATARNDDPHARCARVAAPDRGGRPRIPASVRHRSILQGSLSDLRLPEPAGPSAPLGGRRVARHRLRPAGRHPSRWNPGRDRELAQHPDRWAGGRLPGDWRPAVPRTPRSGPWDRRATAPRRVSARDDLGQPDPSDHQCGEIAEQNALERIGFRREGVMRGLAFDGGRWHDGVLYARLRNDPDR